MATTKTVRLDSGQTEQLAALAARAKVSEARIVGALIEQAYLCGWTFGEGVLSYQPALFISADER